MDTRLSMREHLREVYTYFSAAGSSLSPSVLPLGGEGTPVRLGHCNFLLAGSTTTTTTGTSYWTYGRYLQQQQRAQTSFHKMVYSDS
jgi:hypothetical protein